MSLWGRDPFDDPFFGGGGGRSGSRSGSNGGNRGDPFDSFMGGNPFGRMQNMMSQFDNMMQQQMSQMQSMTRGGGQNAPPGSMMHSSSFSFSSSQGGPGQQPVVVQKSQSYTRGPNGAIEQKQALKDSRSGVDKIRVHRELGGKGRTIERMRDRSGNEESHDTLHNMDEHEARQFDQQWMSSAGSRSIGGGRSGGALGYTGVNSHRSPGATHRAEERGLPAPGLSSSRGSTSVRSGYSNSDRFSDRSGYSDRYSTRAPSTRSHY